jgi:hypothetical protein
MRTDRQHEERMTLTRLRRALALAAGVLLCQALLFFVAANTFGIGVYVIMQTSRGHSVTPVAAVILATCFVGILLSQGLAPILGLAFARAVRLNLAVRSKWVLVLATILGPVLGAVSARATATLGGERGLGVLLLSAGVWGFAIVVTTAIAAIWVLRTSSEQHAA